MTVERLKLLITVKTYPIPSAKYDELVCTAGVTEEGSFIRLYPIRFRDLPFSQQYAKYQWIEVDAEKHAGRDSRKESYRPREDTLKIVGEKIGTQNNWAERARYALRKRAPSMEALWEQQKQDRTSLGIIRPREIFDLEIAADSANWNPRFLDAMKQQRLWDDRSATHEPPRKVPWKFHYHFRCDDERCKGNHRMMIEDWEAGALYWRCVDEGATPDKAAQKVRQKFFDQMCAPKIDTHFFVGTVLEHGTWVIIGVFWPEKETLGPLFDGNP
ncbi:MAG: hypothetical protein HRU76_06445 [Phycisphaeraceae bacterium]|nr:hypothetical protein [Phycisphaerales bacterium]QOJ17232.1 MAG: hypothetical protein HRU76_06445 [Phycisphaeraceae bacterium]